MKQPSTINYSHEIPNSSNFKDKDPSLLSDLKIKNANRLIIIGNLNINSIPN